MGGRGTFASGNIVPYIYETVEIINGVKVLEKTDKSKSGSLPEEAHSSQAYIQLDKDGIFRRMRFYNDDHLPIIEFDYHTEKGFSEQGKSVLHIHEYSKPGIENRLPARMATSSEIDYYRKYLKGVFPT